MSKEFNYSPSECPFRVTFPDKPEISSERALNDPSGNLKTAEFAQIEIDSEQTFLKAEFIILNGQIKDEKEMKNMIKKYVTNNGLSYAGLESDKNEYGTVFKLRAYKTLKIENKEFVVTYTAQYYFNDNKVFVLYAGCPSKSYPSSSINQFYASFQKK
ncbi:MAG TPA: hypothetical protein VIJ95_00520 [Hanamia sp.]